MAWLRNLFGGARRYNNYHDDDNLQLPGGASGNGNGAASRPSSSGSHSNAQTSEFTSLLSMPKEPMTIRGLFVFDKWKAISYVNWFYTLGYCLNGVIAFLFIANSLLYGNAGLAVMSLILAPLYFLLITMLSRVVAEVILGILMVPHLMAQQQQQQQQHFRQMAATSSIAAASSNVYCPDVETMEAGEVPQQGQHHMSRVNVRPDEEVHMATV